MLLLLTFEHLFDPDQPCDNSLAVHCSRLLYIIYAAIVNMVTIVNGVVPKAKMKPIHKSITVETNFGV